MATTPNMGLTVPVPGTTPGPTWATELVNDMTVIDGHDHSSGSGVQITPDGLNINSDLSLGSNAATDAGSVAFSSQSAALSSLDSLYVVAADLYFTDGNGNQIRITQSGSVTGSSGTISGLPSGTASASFAGGTFTFESATNTPATMAVGPVVIGRSAASSKTVTLTPNAGQAANYDLTFPAALPAATYPISVSSAGALSATGTVLAAAGSSSAPSFSFAADNNTGIYNTAPDTVSIVAGGTDILVIDNSTLTVGEVVHGPLGSVSAPTYSFNSDSDTGVYRHGTNTLGISAGGSLAARFDSGAAYFPSGGQSAPGITFDADTNTGLYRLAGDTIGFAAGGASAGAIDANAFYAKDGSAAAPSLTFLNDSNTGIYSYGANQIGLACAGVNILNVSLAGLSILGGGAFKVNIYTGTTGSLSDGSSTSIVSGITIYGAFGYAKATSGSPSTWGPIGGPDASGGSSAEQWQAILTTTPGGDGVNLLNNSGTTSTLQYRIVVFHA